MRVDRRRKRKHRAFYTYIALSYARTHKLTLTSHNWPDTIITLELPRLAYVRIYTFRQRISNTIHMYNNKTDDNCNDGYNIGFFDRLYIPLRTLIVQHSIFRKKNSQRLAKNSIKFTKLILFFFSKSVITVVILLWHHTLNHTARERVSRNDAKSENICNIYILRQTEKAKNTYYVNTKRGASTVRCIVRPGRRNNKSTKSSPSAHIQP